MAFDFNQFIHYANHEYVKGDHQLRYGQFLINFLYEHHPEIVITEDVDCFYNNDKIPYLLNYLNSLK